MFRILGKIVLGITLFILIERFCHRQTDGFLLSKMRLAFTSMPEHPLPSLSDDLSFIKKILTQPLHYIGRGGQCYAFATQDDQYVVKILKYNNNYPKIWLTLFPFPSKCELYRQKKLQEKQRRLVEEYTSYRIAIEELPEETGILYTHFYKQTLPNIDIHLEDKLHIIHKLHADDYQFYIQRKGSPLYPGLHALIQQGNSSRVQDALRHLVLYFVKRCEKHILDSDLGIWRNFAMQNNGMPFQIDIGQFSYDERLADKEERRKELLFFTWGLQEFLTQEDPELVTYLRTCIEQETSAS